VECSIPDCNKPTFCRGWCSAHYSRWQRHGDPLFTKRQSPLPPGAEFKTCPRCGFTKPVDEYRTRKGAKAGGGPSGYCRECMAGYHAEYVKTPHGHARTRAAGTGWSRRNKGYFLKRNYGITLADYEALLAIQGSRCAICGTGEPGGVANVFAVDHCHESLRVRGLLCNLCNLGLGQFKDDPERLRSAAAYLESA